MSTNKFRHWVVALGLIAVAGATAASAPSLARRAPAATPALSAPTVTGDLGEVVVLAPGDLGEVVVHAPHDLGEVLVSVARAPLEGAYLAEVVVTAPRAGAGLDLGATAVATLAAAP